MIQSPSHSLYCPSRQCNSTYTHFRSIWTSVEPRMRLTHALQTLQIKYGTLPLMSILLFLYPLNKQNRVCPLFALLPFCLYLAHCIVTANCSSLHYQTHNMQSR